MLKIFYEDLTYSIAPSSRIFFYEQIQLIIKMGLFIREDKIENADIIFATTKNIKNIIRSRGQKRTSIVIYKPHIEKDTYLRSKNLINKFKSLLNRLISIQIKNYLYTSEEKKIYYVADNRRIWRALRSKGEESFCLKLIPYFIYDTNENLEKSTIETKIIKLGCIGEATVYDNLFRNFDFDYWENLGISIELHVCFYGPVKNNLIKRLSKKCKIKEINWPEDQAKLIKYFEHVRIFLVPHMLYLGNFGLGWNNKLSMNSSQPNNYHGISKFSCNAGRNYLAAGLNKIFITQPVEEVLKEFIDYPSELFYEDAKEINIAILSSLNPAVSYKAMMSINNFRQREFVQKDNLYKFYQWCGEISNAV